jgi:choline dehydrogenase-like flavoprotein
MQMTYPSAAEVDTWAYLGNPSWSWKDLEPYYRRSQTLNRPTDDVSALLGTSHYNPSKDGKGGPIQVSFYKSCSELQLAWLETFEIRGHRMDGDPLSGHAIGGFTNPASVDPTSMSRSYSTNAYYQPNSARRNLFVLTDAHVQKIHFDQTQVTTGKVTASRVSFIHGGKEHMVQARREVILCAGAIQSPQLLELSGIGSRAILQAHNIDNVIENPNVGENLQDHALVGISYEVRDSHTSLDALRDPVLLNEALTAYATEKKGPFAEGVQASAFVPLTPSLSGRDDGDLAEDISIENSNESIVLPYQVSPHSKADHV